VVRESDAVADLRRELGVLAGYSRTAIANAETGSAIAARQLWERADQALDTGELFARGYDRIQARRAAESRAARLVPDVGPAQAGRACAERGWPVQEDAGGRLRLVTGTEIDVLEVPRAAGLVAAGWWLFTQGVPDEIRGLRPRCPIPPGRWQ
jgi:hypothetical protein